MVVQLLYSRKFKLLLLVDQRKRIKYISLLTISKVRRKLVLRTENRPLAQIDAHVGLNGIAYIRYVQMTIRRVHLSLIV